MTFSARRTVIISTIAACLGLASSVYAGLATSGQFEQVFRQSMNGQTRVMKQTLYWSGNKFRSEGVMGKDKVVTLMDGKMIYRYFPNRKVALSGGKFQRPKGVPANVLESLAMAAKETPKKLKKVGTQKVGGFNCDVYVSERKMGNQKFISKSWINKDPKFPIEVKMEAKRGGDLAAMTIQHVKLNVKYPDSFFTLPKGVKVMEHPPMPTAPNPHKGMPSPHGAAPKK